jgi:catechol 2,3-dioxygenase-like lactoylglutathione lyase family enzyme
MLVTNPEKPMPATLPMAPAVRFHLSLNVSDLGRSVEFYRTLFGQPPAKQRADYAKFELDDPPLVLSLEPATRGQGGALNHLGFRLPDSETLVRMQERLERAGVHSQREEGVECCYAKQTKFWVTDPDHTLWEMYVLESDLDHRGVGQTREQMLPAQEAAAPAAPVVWEHRLGEPVPDRVPLADGSADEVRLRGTFNANLPEADLRRALQEAQRVLKEGGTIVVHTLVADRSFPNGKPQLPGPAAYVQQVPLEKEPQRAVEAAGFFEVRLEKFGASPCFQHDGVQMRELLLTAVKVADGERDRIVLYKGPFRVLADDQGNVYRRGERVRVTAQTSDLLRRGPLAEQFLFLS